MIAVFYPIDSFMRVEHDSRTRYLANDVDVFKEILKNVDYNTIHIYDLNSKMGNQCFGGYFDFQEMYNDEDIDKGFWVAILNVTPQNAIGIINQFVKL